MLYDYKKKYFVSVCACAHTQTSRNIDQHIKIHTIKHMDIGVDSYENVIINRYGGEHLWSQSLA